MYLIQFTLLSFLLFFGSLQSEEQKSELFRDQKGSFEVQFPENWEVKTGVMGTDVIALAPVDGEEDLFRENVNVIHADLESPITQEEYYQINMDSLEQLLTDFDLEQADDVEVDGVKSKRLIYTHRMGVINAKVMQYLILVGQDAYVVTFTTDPQMFDQYRGIFDQIMNSFKLQQTAAVGSEAPEANG